MQRKKQLHFFTLLIATFEKKKTDNILLQHFASQAEEVGDDHNQSFLQNKLTKRCKNI